MTTTWRNRAALLRQSWKLLVLLALVCCAAQGKTQIPNAQTDYLGTCWYYYTGSPYWFRVDMTLYAQIPDRQGQWASLYGYLETSDSYYSVSGTIWKSGWADLYAFDYYWGNPLHFYGWLQDSYFPGWTSFAGTWEEYIYGQGYVPQGTFYMDHVPYNSVY